MKKLYLMMAAVLLGMMSVMVTSCEWNDDDEIAYTLEGTWSGNMYMSSEWDGYVYDATYSEICFLRDPYRYSSGSGYWIDYYRNAGWGRDYVANHIDWTVSGRTITVRFREEGTTLWIENFRLSDSYFSGVIYDGNTRVDFRLQHTSSPNWNDYYWGYEDWGYYYYSKENKLTRAADADGLADKAETKQGSTPALHRFVRSGK